MTDARVGRRLGRYELQQLLGTGGTAHVYRALDTSLQRAVAVKILHEDALRDPEFIQRFEREARTLAGLRHPTIVQIYDYGQQDGLNYIVTQFLPGKTLEEELDALNARKQYMDRDKVLETLTQISSALDYAHAQGIVHRDIKPGNVIRDTSGDAVLTDFGIARAISGDGVTQVGTVIGTPAYLSPEQAQGTALSPASDIYALGILAYELLTGHVPFDDPNPMAILVDHVRTPPPAPSSFRADLPVAVDQVMLKVLAKEPSERFASAGAFVRALTAAWQTPVVAAPTPPDVHNQATVVSPVAPIAPRPQPAPAVDMHNQATVPNVVPARPQTTARPQPAPAPTSARPVPPPVAPKVYRHNPWPLIIGLVVGLALIGAVIAALRPQRGEADIGSSVPPTAAVASAVPTEAPPTEVLPTEAPPTEIPPTDVPPTEVPPTEAPAPTEPPPTEPAELPTVPVVEPTPAPPPANDVEALIGATRPHLDVMRVLVDQNLSGGIINEGTAKRVLDGVDELNKQIEQGDKADAIEELDKVWRVINREVERKRMSEQLATNLHNELLLVRGALK